MIYKQPKISVLIPAYNAEKFIRSTLQAVLAQTFQNFEVIIIDDASTDNTETIIKSTDDPRIKYIKNEKNLGISATRNKLCSLAQGEYIAILDHDDLCLPDRLEQQAAFLDTHPDIAMVGSYFELYCPPHNRAWWQRLIINLGWIWCHPLFPDIHDALKGNILMHPTAMYRRADFADIFYQEQYTPAEDYDFVVQALSKGLKLANIPKILLKYNMHGHNFSCLQKNKMKQADKNIKQKIARHLNIKNYKPYPYWKTILSKLRLKYLKGK